MRVPRAARGLGGRAAKGRAAGQRRLPVRFTEYGDESDPGPYPIPLRAPIERGGDRHVLVLQRGACRLYELYLKDKL